MTPSVYSELVCPHQVNNTQNFTWKNTYRTRNELEQLRIIHHRWQNQQDLIRKKYQLARESDLHGFDYAPKRCLTASTYITSQAEAILKRRQSFSNDIFTKYARQARNNLSKKRQTTADKHISTLNNDRILIPPMYCSKCQHNLTGCSCPDGLGAWWMKLHPTPTDKPSGHSSMVTLRERRVHFGWRSGDVSSSIKRIDSESNIASKCCQYDMQPKFVLLTRDNHQSLVNFIRTTTIECKQNLSSMTSEQLRKLITNQGNIQMYHSILELALAMNNEQSHAFLCHVYIDPLFYSNISNTVPLSRSRILADNIDLTQAMQSVQTLASMLDARIDRTTTATTEFLQQRHSSTRQETLVQQRKTTLSRQSLYLASKTSRIDILQK